MNHLESRKRFIDHVGNSICHTIYMVDRCRGELMSRVSDQCNGVSRETIYNLNMTQSEVDVANDALEGNVEIAC